MPEKKKKCIVVTPYPYGLAPGPRFRYEQYLSFLEEKSIDVKIAPFVGEDVFKILYKPGHLFKKISGVLLALFNRLILLFKILQVEYVFLYREALPFGPPVFEWVVAKIFRKKIIYDFDDAIWHTDLDRSQWLKVWLRNASKTNKIIKWSWKISCGNEYLCEHARQYNQNVVLNPTTIDTESLHNEIKDQTKGRLTIGWTGSHSTLKYLEPMVPLVAQLEKEIDFDFIVICNQEPAWALRSLRFLPWKKDTEIEDLLRFNFGLMPLPDDEWSKGKCGFKALQYMALGMPALVSPVGVNSEIVEHGVNGFICTTDEDWLHYIRILLQDEKLRTAMGKKAREKIIAKYSVDSNRKNFLALFEA
jgi:glycosyltransferase involved in cell wall biosynthesis